MTITDIIDIVGVYLAFYGFGLVSGIFVMWVENKAASYGRMGRDQHP